MSELENVESSSFLSSAPGTDKTEEVVKRIWKSYNMKNMERDDVCPVCGKTFEGRIRFICWDCTNTKAFSKWIDQYQLIRKMRR